MTQRDGMGREVEGGFRMGNTCTPVVDSCWCTAKPIQYCNVKEINKSKKKKKKEMPMALLSDCLGAVRAAWVCWGPNLCSFCFFSLCVYFPISSLLRPILANTTMSKSGKWTVLVKLEAQVPEYFEQHWWGHLSSTPEASKELSAYFFLSIRLHFWNRPWLLKLHELVSIPKVL